MSAITTSQNIAPFLWFDGDAAAAMELYTSVFPNSSIISQKKWGPGTSFPPDWIMGGEIIIDGLKVNLFDAGPQFKFNESVSFFVSCDDQEQIDTYWKRLTENGGEESQCGWLKDRFGLSWQIVPTSFMKRVMRGEPARVGKMMQAMMGMKKMIIADLEAAYNS